MPKRPRLVINVDGATDQELTRGLDAAMAVFVKANVHPAICAHAAGKREWWDNEGFDDDLAPTAEEMDHASVWDEAEGAAIAACCAGWPEKPSKNAGIEIDEDDPVFESAETFSTPA